MDPPNAGAARVFVTLDSDSDARPSSWVARLRKQMCRAGILCAGILVVVVLAGSAGYSTGIAQAPAPAPAEARQASVLADVGVRATPMVPQGGQPTDTRLVTAIEELTRLLRGGVRLAGGQAEQAAAALGSTGTVAGGAIAAEPTPGGRPKAPDAATIVAVRPKAVHSATYTTRCSKTSACGPDAGCSPPLCSSGDFDSGVECTGLGIFFNIFFNETSSCRGALCTRVCVSMAAQHGGGYVLGDADGHPISCGSERASADPSSAPEVVSEAKQWTAQRDEFLLLHLWGGGGGGASPWQVSQADGPSGRTEAWVCGGGGGGGAYVKAMVRLRAGRTYRVEVGQGGAGGHANPRDGRAKAGGATQLLEMVPGGPWRVLAEAAGGSGAGAYEETFQYMPGGQGGLATPHSAHLEATAGASGSPSTSHLGSGDSRLLPPEKLLRNYTTKETYRMHNGYTGGYWRTHWRQHDSPKGRMPCGLAGPRGGCVAVDGHTVHDYFLTCSDAFDGGFAHPSCWGTACFEIHRQPKEACALRQHIAHRPPYVFLSREQVGPQGGPAVSTAMSHSFRAGRGGSGACPVLQVPREDPSTTTTTPFRGYGDLPSPWPMWRFPAHVTHSPRGSAGLPGADGLAILHACTRRGAYRLALQRCVPEAGPWTVHGLWREGAAYCAGAPPFDRAALPPALQTALAASWPTCVRDGSDLGFWEQEWVEHGSCLGMSQAAYFQMALTLFERHAPSCANTTDAECRICLTKDFEICGGLAEM